MKIIKKVYSALTIITLIVVFCLVIFYLITQKYNITELVSLSKVFYNISIPIAAIIGGIYTYFLFLKRHEEATLNVKINTVDPIENFINEKLLRINVLIENNGKRDVNLIYDDFEFTYSKVLNAIPLQLEKTIILNSLKPIISNHRGKLRRGVNINIPLLISVEEYGIYFFEFKIKIDLNVFNAAIKKDEDRNIIWSDRIFYNYIPNK